MESNDENQNQVITDSRTHEMAVKTQTECQIIWNESLDEVEEQPNDSFIGKETENQSFVTEESNVETEEEFCSKDRSKGYYLRVFDKNTNNDSMKKKDKRFKCLFSDCDKCFASERSLINHYLIHFEKNFICEFMRNEIQNKISIK